jgi:molybdate transport system substrate-binding protein
VTDLRVLSTIGVRTVVEELAPAFERSHNCSVSRVYDTSIAMMKKFAEGESGDVTICTSNVIDDLIAQGKVNDRTDLTRSFIGIAVKNGASRPDIATPEAFKATLLAAKSIVRSGTGASGLYLESLIERLGLTEALAAKVLVRKGFVGEVVARGEAEIAVQQISELMQADGVDIVGPLPDELQSVTIFSAAIFTNAKHSELAKAFIADLASPAHAALIRRNGMERAG